MSAHCGHDHSISATGPAARRALWAALVINATMVIVELSAGVLVGSVGLQADAADFFGDSVNYGLSLMALNLGLIWRTRLATLKGSVMGLFSVWVTGMIVYHALNGTVPSAPLMGGIGAFALLANLTCAVILFRFRGADANMKAVWVCTRNDALSNVAVIIAASGVWASNSGIPDLVVAAIIGGLAMFGAIEVLRAARQERRHGVALPVGSDD